MSLTRVAVKRSMAGKSRYSLRSLFLIMTILIAGMIVCSGCSSTGWGRKSSSSSDTETMDTRKQLQVAADLRIDDVPVPVGFKLDAGDSFAFQNDYTRVGLLKYSGRANITEVINFYKEQMPLYNWILVNLVEYERSMLNFEKDNQSCIITCEGGMRKTVLTISTAPKSQEVSR